MTGKQRYQRLLAIWLVVLVLSWPLSLPAYAWQRHDLVTEASIANLDWLKLYDHILVTPYTYQDPDAYDPHFQPSYLGPGIAHFTTARDILITYSDEPDWNMDTGLQLSGLQSLMGGSQGYRHQYYQFLFGLLHIGVAPSRGQHFYDMAQIAFNKGDRYWGFRFLARMLHYMQDVNQPYHTRPILYSWIWESGFSLRYLVHLGKNLHFAYETYVAIHLLQQLQSKPPVFRQPYLLGMVTVRPQPVQSVAEAIRQAAVANFRQRSHFTLQVNDDFWPARVRSKNPDVEPDPTPAECLAQPGSDAQRLMDEVTIRSLLATAEGTQTLLQYARSNIIR